MTYSDGFAAARTLIAIKASAAALQGRLPESRELAVIQRPHMRLVYVPWIRSSWLIFRVVCLFLLLPRVVNAQVTTLREAIREAEVANRTIKIAELDRDKAARDVSIAKTHRFPVLSLTALGSQPLTQVGITL